MKIAVAGTGYVGLVTGTCLSEKGHTVTCVDNNEEKIQMLNRNQCPICEDGLEELIEKNTKANRLKFTTDYKSAYRDAEIILIGVETPERKDGSVNMQYITVVCMQIAESIQQDCVIVVKSTVEVGTNDKIEEFIRANISKDIHVEVVSNPEFLAQGTAVNDILNSNRIIIGSNNKKADEKIREMYQGFDAPVVSVGRKAAEMIKYASNSFLALKISYINEIANLCEKVGIDVNDVSKGMGLDPRIGNSFLKAGIGYGGSCFPKDTKALCDIANKHGMHITTIEAVTEINKAQKMILLNKAKKRVLSFYGSKVAVLGLAFKAKTDDIREAPAIQNVLYLLNEGANIYAVDPVAQDNFKRYVGDMDQYRGSITYTEDVNEALNEADMCFIFTEWNSFKDIDPEIFVKKMKMPLVYDGRNIYDVEKMDNAGVEYYSIGR